MENVIKQHSPITIQCCILTHKDIKLWKNIVRKGEIAWDNQFLLFSQSFLLYMAHFYAPISKDRGGNIVLPLSQT